MSRKASPLDGGDVVESGGQKVTVLNCCVHNFLKLVGLLPALQQTQNHKQQRAFQNKNVSNGKLGGHFVLSMFVNND
jgi:hypothetical protein